MRVKTSVIAMSAASLLAVPALSAQTQFATATTDSTTPAPAAAPAPKKKVSLARPQEIQNFRANDQRGVNVFETPKDAGATFDGFKLSWGAAFMQNFQGIKHSNTAAAKEATIAGTTTKYNANELMKIGKGFNNASANLYLNAQLAPGIRVALTSYLSSRHHNETWVKDGYLLIDQSPIDLAPLNTIMKYVTVRAGHFEVNYGDAHFRRTDNGNTIYNPFVGNLLMDAFTTEVGGEVTVRAKGWMAMGGVTGGEIKGNVLTPSDRKPAFLGKLGYDKQVTKLVRTRLTGSMYANSSSPAQTLYAGDRGGSPYFFALENTQATSTGQAFSGTVNPAFRHNVRAMQVNPFVKVGGLELFGVAEQAKGKSVGETVDRKWTQYAADVTYRLLPNEQAYVAGRYNTAKGNLAGITNQVSVDRTQLGAGWYITPTVILKGEYVTQKYNDFPTLDIRNGGKFSGFMLGGGVSF